VSDLLLQSFRLEQLKAIRNHIENLDKTLSELELDLINVVSQHTMLPPARILDSYRSAQQAAKRHPAGSIIEFGVFRGGGLFSLMAGCSVSGNFSGNVIGFDTFEGHVHAPQEDEVDLHGTNQASVFRQFVARGEAWAMTSLEEVERALAEMISHSPTKAQSTFLLVEGDACITAQQLPSLCPNGISLLRLDMDWYEPTKVALGKALPILLPNAIIIADDYGHHSGVKRAVDEILSSQSRAFDHTMTDYSCLRICLLD
jgi:hypothetical protein